MHGDIRPKSILLTRKTHGHIEVALDNFAHVTTVNAVKAAISAETIAPDKLMYTAPEVLKGEPASQKSDIWSLGVTLYVMATGTFPFASHEDILTSPPVKPVFLNAEFWDYIGKLLSKDPAKRPTAVECHGSSK